MWRFVLSVVVVAAYLLVRPEIGAPEPASTPRAAVVARRPPELGRVVFVLIDSLNRSVANDPALCPTLASLRPTSLHGDLQGTLPASTVPSTRTMLEGSVAGYVAGLYNFASREAPAGSWPAIARASGMRLAVASDHTLMGLLEGLYGPSLSYETVAPSPEEIDTRGAEAALGWLSRDEADVVLLHLIGLDKVSHREGPDHPRYLERIRFSDETVARIAALLGPRDSLIVTGDHGHNKDGNHIPETAYLARGPAFVAGRVDLQQPTMALLLAAASGTRLPPGYEGEVPAAALRAALVDAPTPEALVALRDKIAAGQRVRQEEVRGQTFAFVPWLLAALLLLAAAAASLIGSARSEAPQPLGREALRRGAALFATLATLALGSALIGRVWGKGAREWLWFGPAENLAHYAVSLALAVALAAALLHRVAKLRGSVAAGAAALGLPLMVHLPSKDYFASPYTALYTLLPGAALLLGAALARRDRLALAGIGAAAAVVVVLRSNVADGLGSALAVVACGACAAAGSFSASGRFSLPRALALAAGFALLSGPLELGVRRTVLVAVLAAGSGIVSRAVQSARPAAGGWVSGIVLAVALSLAWWFAIDALSFASVGFAFAVRWSIPHSVEAVVAAQATALTVSKYALALGLVAAAQPAFGSGPAAGAAAVARRTCLALLSARALMAAAWVAGSRLDLASRCYELAMEEAILLAVCAPVALLALATVERIERLAPRFGASASPAERAAPVA